MPPEGKFQKKDKGLAPVFFYAGIAGLFLYCSVARKLAVFDSSVFLQ